MWLVPGDLCTHGDVQYKYYTIHKWLLLSEATFKVPSLPGKHCNTQRAREGGETQAQNWFW